MGDEWCRNFQPASRGRFLSHLTTVMLWSAHLVDLMPHTLPINPLFCTPMWVIGAPYWIQCTFVHCEPKALASWQAVCLVKQILHLLSLPFIPSYLVDRHSALPQTVPSCRPVLRLPAGLLAVAAAGPGWGVQVVPGVSAAVLLLAARKQQRSQSAHAQRHRDQLWPGLHWHSEHCRNSILLVKKQANQN